MGRGLLATLITTLQARQGRSAAIPIAGWITRPSSCNKDLLSARSGPACSRSTQAGTSTFGTLRTRARTMLRVLAIGDLARRRARVGGTGGALYARRRLGPGGR